MSFTPNYTSNEELAFFKNPGVVFRARQLPPEQLAHLVRDLKQFKRAEDSGAIVRGRTHWRRDSWSGGSGDLDPARG
jgi:hypothetical protein